MSDFLGFWFMVILNLYGVPFHAVVVLGPEHDFLFKSTSTHCALWKSITLVLKNQAIKKHQTFLAWIEGWDYAVIQDTVS